MSFGDLINSGIAFFGGAAAVLVGLYAITTYNIIRYRLSQERAERELHLQHQTLRRIRRLLEEDL
jgi:hypothetical protein